MPSTFTTRMDYKMATVSKIASPTLYITYDEPAIVNRCFAWMKKLENIEHGTHLHWDKAALEPLNSWVYGHEYEMRSFKNYPIFLWQEVYDNFDVIQMCAETDEELDAFIELRKSL